MCINNLIGKRFGRLVVLDRNRTDKNKHIYYLCKCDCGKEKIIQGNSLRYGLTKSCGCLQKEIASKCNKTHGKTKSKLFSVWNEMKHRCYNPNHKAYKNYGERGITVCEEWLKSFSDFYDFSISHGWKDGLSIDRIDVNSGYNKENIRFVDMRTQQNNRRNNKIIEYNGNKKTLSEWCIELNLNYPKIQARINKLNWEIKRAFETP